MAKVAINNKAAITLLIFVFPFKNIVLRFPISIRKCNITNTIS